MSIFQFTMKVDENFRLKSSGYTIILLVYRIDVIVLLFLKCKIKLLMMIDTVL